MKGKLRHIHFYILLIYNLFAYTYANGQEVVYAGDTTNLSVIQEAGITYNWDLYLDSTVNFATTPGQVPDTSAYFLNNLKTGSSVSIFWEKPGIYFYKVTAVDQAGCSNNVKVRRIEILEPIPTARIVTSPICPGDPVTLTIHFTGTGPFDISFTDGTNTYNYQSTDSVRTVTIDPGPVETIDYSILQIQDQFGTNVNPNTSVEQTVKPLPVNSKIYQYSPN